jgi:hypothetical protein
MSSRPEELPDRTKAFALRVIRLFRSLPDTHVLGKTIVAVWNFGRRQLSSRVPRAIQSGIHCSDCDRS